MPEKELVRFLLNESHTLYWFLNFVVEPAIGPPEERNGWNYLFFAEVPRSALCLRPGQPGDVDILIIPTFEGRPRAEYAAAVEVKRLALRGPNWLKNVDRYGITQASGLLRAGIPYIGILHLIVNLPGPKENWKKLMHARVIDDSGRIEVIGNKNSDMTGSIAAERQFYRIISMNPKDEIGINCIALTQTCDEYDGRIWFSRTSPEFRFAKKNPMTHPTMIDILTSFAEWAMPYCKVRPADLR